MVVDKKEVLARLNIAEFFRDQIPGFRSAGDGEIKVCCPFHDDSDPSLYANTTTGQYYCHGCHEKGDVFTLYQRLHKVDFKVALEALANVAGVVESELVKQQDTQQHKQCPALLEFLAASYHYFDSDNVYVFTVQRFEQPGAIKNFRQWRYDYGAKEWVYNVQGVNLIPYRLPEVVKADTVYIVEGEKDVDSLASLGITATCNPGGAGKWRGEFGAYLKGKHVVILPDNDEPGNKHAQDVREKLLPYVASVRVVRLPGLPKKGDVSDWIANGGTADELMRLVALVAEEVAPPAPFSFATLDIDELRAGKFIETKPDKIRWTLMESLPQGSLGFVVSNGGVGKSWFLLQVGMSVASNIDCMDGVFEVGERGNVFAVFAEDVKPVIHARAQAVFGEFISKPRDGLSLDITCQNQRIAELQEHLFLLPGSGIDLRLMHAVQGNLAPTQVYQDLLSRLRCIDNLKLVILDPVARFYSGNENDNVQVTYFCSLLERIASETGATVLASHHMNKASSNPNDSSYNALFQGAIRGASGFTNAARWQLNFTTLNSNEVQKAGGNSNQHANYLAGKVVKKNVGKPENRFWIERQEGGVLRRFISKLEADDNGSAEKNKIVNLIEDLMTEGKRTTKIMFAKEYAREIGISRRRVESLIDEMVTDKQLRVIPCRNKKGSWTDYLTASISAKKS